MFSFQIKRRCGHEEEITVPGPPEGMGLQKYVTNLDKEESAKLCAECQEMDDQQPPWVDKALTAIVWFAIVLVFSLFCWLAGC